jgi:hypothetical protein
MLIPDPEPSIGKCGALERSGNKIDLRRAKTKIGRKKIVGEKAKKRIGVNLTVHHRRQQYFKRGYIWFSSKGDEGVRSLHFLLNIHVLQLLSLLPDVLQLNSQSLKTQIVTPFRHVREVYNKPQTE